MDNDLGKRIKRLEADILSYKTTQPVGSDSVRAFTTQTNNIWDIEETLVEFWPGDGYGGIVKNIRFKSRNQLAPFGQLRWQATINGNNYNYATTSNNFNSSTIPYIWSHVDNYYATSDEINDPTILRWLLVASGPVGTVIRIKLFVDATDAGRLYIRDGYQ